MTAALDPHMTSGDSFLMHMESDPLFRSTICAVVLFDRNPGFDAVVDRFDRASRLVPFWRHRAVATPVPFTTPRWVVDEDFDLSWHVRRIRAPQPGTFETVLTYARNLASGAFDLARPLWLAVVVEGLADGGVALVLKVHHALTDGVGGMQIAEHVFDVEPDAGDPGPLPPAPTPEPFGRRGIVRGALRHDAEAVLGMVRRRLGAAPGDTARFLRDPVGTTRQQAAVAASFARLLAPVNRPLSPRMTGRSLHSHYDVLDMAFSDLSRASRSAGVTINTGFLAGLTGGLRRYHEHHGEVPEELWLTVPISTRRADSPIGGNQTTGLRYRVPVAVTDPAARMVELQHRFDDLRAEPGLALVMHMPAILNALPSAALASMMKNIDLVASNVPGIPVPIYLAGARATGFFGLGPIAGTALNCTLVSYAGRCSIGVHSDRSAVPDPEVLRDCLRDGFDEVLRSAKRNHGGVRTTAEVISSVQAAT